MEVQVNANEQDKCNKGPKEALNKKLAWVTPRKGQLCRDCFNTLFIPWSLPQVVKHNQLGGSKKAGNLLIHWKLPTWATSASESTRLSWPSGWHPFPGYHNPGIDRQTEWLTAVRPYTIYLKREAHWARSNTCLDEQKLYAHLKGSISGNKSKGPLPPALRPANKSCARKVSSPDQTLNKWRASLKGSPVIWELSWAHSIRLQVPIIPNIDFYWWLTKSWKTRGAADGRWKTGKIGLSQ